MTSSEYKEVTESLQWCERKGFTAFAQFYRELLDEEHRRGKLPPEAYPEQPVVEEESSARR